MSTKKEGKRPISKKVGK